ncbi:MAG: Uma2 family endonuclease [Lachnospiraceae bacterium]|nr:Uma2 family endonuclease [Lachnospiraceae bacterium]
MTENDYFKEKISAQKNEEQKDTVQKGTGQTSREQKNTEKTNTEKTNTEKPNTEQKSTGQTYTEFMDAQRETGMESMVAEAPARYLTQKRQGEYTLEDYFALPDDQRVELIDGVFYDMAAPNYIHQDIGVRICRCFMDYIDSKRGSCFAFAAPVDVQLDCDDKTILQPDVLIVCDPSKLKKGRIFGAPDLVVEILSRSTSKKDRVLKLAKYRRAGVKEYWIVDPDWRQVKVYEFEKSDTPAEYGFDDIVPVGIYAGDCKVDFSQIYERIRPLYDTM